MEKFVIEALFIMNEPEVGLERMKKRYYGMVDVSPWTTLSEIFSDNIDNIGTGSNNHAWSGGGITILAQYVCGLYPIEPAWKSFMVKPQLGELEYAETGNETISGKIAVKITRVKSGMDIVLTVPKSSEAVVYITKKNKKVTINGEKATSNGKDGNFMLYRVKSGNFNIIAR